MILQEPEATQDIVQRLRETEDRFKVMADSSPVMLWMSAVDSNCYFFNKPWLDFTGRTLEQEVGAGWCEGVHFEDFQHCLDTYLDHFNARQPFRMRYRLRRHDGQYRWLLDTGVPRYSPDGTFMGFVGSCIDIQEMVEASEALANLNATLERRVEERTAQLADANRELENFAYSVSHDLRAPLRQIGSYAELIRKELPAELVRGALERYLGFLSEGAERAQALVRDVLEFSRVSGAGLQPQRVAIAPLVAEVQRMLPDRESAIAGALGDRRATRGDRRPDAPAARPPEPARERAELHRAATRGRDPRSATPSRAASTSSRSRTTASASIRRRRIACSSCSSGCTPRKRPAAAGSGWPTSPGS